MATDEAPKSVMDLITQTVNKHADPEPAPAPAPAPDPVSEPDEEILFPMDVSDTSPEETTPPEKSEEQLALEEAMSSDEPSKNGKAWGALKSRNRELEEELAKLKTSVPVDQITKLEQKIAEQEEVISRVRLEESESFKQAHDYQIVGDLSQIARFVEQQLGKTPEEAKAITEQYRRLPMRDRNARLNDDVPEFAGMLNQMFYNVDMKIQRRADALKNAAATRLALQESETHVAQVNSIKSVEANLAKAIEELTTTHQFYKVSKEKSALADNWNRSRDLRIQAVKQTLLNNKPEEITRLVAAGFAVPELQKEMARLQKIATDAKAELAKYKSHKPGVNNNDVETGKETPKFSGQTTVDGVAAFLSSRMPA